MTLQNAFENLAVESKQDDGNASLAAIAAAVADLDGNTDNIESLLGAISTAVSDLDGNTDGIEALLTTANGNTSAIGATLTAISGLVDQLESYTDGIEGLLGTGNTNTGNAAATLASILAAVDQLEGYTDGLETLIGTTNTTLATISTNVDQLEGYTDGIEALIGATNTALGTANASLTAISGFVDQLEGYTDGIEALIGATNTALATINTVQTNGTQKAIARGAAKGATAAGDVTSTTASADRQPLDVILRDAAGAVVTPTSGGLTDTQLRAARVPVIDSDGNTKLDGLQTTLTAISGFVDQLEGYTDGIEALLGTGNTNTGATNTAIAGLQATLTAISGFVDQLEGYTDGIEALLGTGNTNTGNVVTALATANAHLVNLETYTDTLEGLLASANAQLTQISTNTGHLIDGNQKAIVRGGLKGATAAADVTSTAGGADHQMLDVIQRDVAGAVVTPLTDTALRATPVPISGTVTVQDGSGPLTVDGAVNVNELDPTTFKGVGQTTVALVAVQLSATAFTPARGVLVKASSLNSAFIYVGRDNTVSATTGFELAPGESNFLPINAATGVWLISTLAAQSVSWEVF